MARAGVAARALLPADLQALTGGLWGILAVPTSPVLAAPHHQHDPNQTRLQEELRQAAQHVLWRRLLGGGGGGLQARAICQHPLPAAWA